MKFLSSPEVLRRQLERKALSRQNGVVLRSDAMSAGLTSSQIDWTVKSRRWAPGVARGTFMIRSSAVSDVSRLTSAVLGVDGIAWGCSALALWDLHDFPRRPIVALDRQVRSRHVQVVCTSTFGHLRTTLRHHIPTVGIEFALASASARLPRRAFDEALDEALRRRLTTWERVEASFALFARPGRPGVAQLRSVAADRHIDSAVPLSAWSRDFAKKLEASGLPRPQLEWRVRNQDGQFIAQVDLAYPDNHYALELDSIAYHLNSEAFEVDRRRDSLLLRAGWNVSRFTWRQYNSEWAQVVSTVRAGLNLL